MELYFSQHFGVSPKVLEDYGAFDVSLASDLPLFVDPFLLFNSKKQEYRDLHDGMIRYLTFLRDRAAPDLDPGLIKSWYMFQEGKQNWLGFTVLGNSGSGLGKDFARALHSSLGSILRGFGSESITKGAHLEKLALIKEGVGRDYISDLTTNLIKGYLLEYTQAFALAHLSADRRGTFSVARAVFIYETETWKSSQYELPALRGDYVLLTPADILTKDDTWISRSDLVREFSSIPYAIEDEQLRAQVNNYLFKKLSNNPTKKEYSDLAAAAILQFLKVIDYYIRQKEDTGEQAVGLSARRRQEVFEVFVQMVQRVVEDIRANTSLHLTPVTSYDEALTRANGFKQYVENQDGYRLLNKAGQERPLATEKKVQLFFGLIFFGSEFDVNREVNNGRGPVDFKLSKGAVDKSLIEIKLARNSQLKRNLQNQVEVYEKANGTRTSVKMIVCYTEADVAKGYAVLKELDLRGEKSIVVIDARADNKPSGSKA
ncbi:hypothetical protein C5C59_05710 [Rathayibacter sp. AY1F4]|nr:hypothetical protein C5C26_11410 [Rathayibacter sp. AY2B1]PPG72797.1 hypothetical protein C5C59_05710 [Rathayibacter sp. AY1F4]